MLIERVEEWSQTLLKWAERLLTAEKLADVFRPLPRTSRRSPLTVGPPSSTMSVSRGGNRP